MFGGDHACAFAREGQRARAPDAHRRSGDDSALPFSRSDIFYFPSFSLRVWGGASDDPEYITMIRSMDPGLRWPE